MFDNGQECPSYKSTVLILDGFLPKFASSASGRCFTLDSHASFPSFPSVQSLKRMRPADPGGVRRAPGGLALDCRQQPDRSELPGRAFLSVAA